MHVERAEPAPEINEILGVQDLISNKDGAVREQRFAYRVELVVAKGAREVDAGDLRADGRTDRLDRDGHRKTGYSLFGACARA